MTGTPLIIDDNVRAEIAACVALAEACPVDVMALKDEIKDPEKKESHMAQMSLQTIKVPLAYLVTFSIEDGHPCGRCRHLSMSVQREGRVPNPIGLWEVAKEFGFWGKLSDCAGVWKEDLQGHGVALNIVQPMHP